MQWLVVNQPAFDARLIAQNVLERLVRNNVRSVEGTTTRGHRPLTLFTKQQPADRFVLVLEGRLSVVIGQVVYGIFYTILSLYLMQCDMEFEAGPWHCFGAEMLKKLLEHLSRANSTVSPSSDTVVAYSVRSPHGNLWSPAQQQQNGDFVG